MAYRVPVEVALVAERLTKVCVPVQELALVRLSEATTAPTFGEIVRVPSAFVTLETPVTKHVPLYERQPVARLRPPPKEEVAVPVVLMPFVDERPKVEIPPTKVEVALVVATTTPNCPRTASTAAAWRVLFDESPPANVEVAVEVDVSEPVVREPVVTFEKIAETERKILAKREVEVAFVVLELAKV